MIGQPLTHATMLYLQILTAHKFKAHKHSPGLHRFCQAGLTIPQAQSTAHAHLQNLQRHSLYLPLPALQPLKTFYTRLFYYFIFGVVNSFLHSYSQK